MTKLFWAALALLTVSPAAAQTVSGCGTTEITEADAKNATKLAKDADCFHKAASVATAAETAQRAQILAITPAPTPTPAPTTASWTFCGNENAHCDTHGPAVVRYGATPSFSTKTVADGIDCTNAVFSDPSPRVSKSCSYQAAASPTATPVISPAPTPSQAPAGTGDTAPAAPGSYIDVQPAIIPSNFRTDWEKGPLVPQAQSMAPDNVGAFRFTCTPGQLSYDDPIIFPGQPGKSHLHQWFGNTLANAYSTYTSLRTTGDSTCMTRLNRSAYWSPAMLDGHGNVVRPDYIAVYYKRLPKSDPNCFRMAKKGCIEMPRGLRFTFGYDMARKDNSHSGGWNCDGAGDGQWHTLREEAVMCTTGAHLGSSVGAPSCWDGKNLDSPDHRSHMGYPNWDSGYEKCDDAHPYVIPAFTLKIWYLVAPTDTPKDWHLSSDEMATPDGTTMMMPAGSTLHSDWFGAWDDPTLDQWTANCIDKMLNCSAGDLGDTTHLFQMAPFSWTATPHLVPVPPRS